MHDPIVLSPRSQERLPPTRIIMAAIVTCRRRRRCGGPERNTGVLAGDEQSQGTKIPGLV